jgi:hypothetical protein
MHHVPRHSHLLQCCSLLLLLQQPLPRLLLCSVGSPAALHPHLLPLLLLAFLQGPQVMAAGCFELLLRRHLVQEQAMQLQTLQQQQVHLQLVNQLLTCCLLRWHVPAGSAAACCLLLCYHQHLLLLLLVLQAWQCPWYQRCQLLLQ